MTASLLSLLLLLADPAAAPPPGVTIAAAPAADAFDRLKALEGSWRIADHPDAPLRIRFSLTAGGTVLVESWERKGAPHSLTLYHRDDAALVATHYCPQGNQPRLVLLLPAGPELRFAFRDATDLDAGESHLHDLAFDLSDPGRIVRSEVYRRGDTAEPSTLTLVRDTP
jgi:hypothetical protein